MGIQINGQTDTVTSTTAGGSVKVTPLAASTGLNVGTGASISSPATNVLTLGTNNVESIRINSSNQVGIGTANPSQTLHVQGGAWLNNNSGDTQIRAQSLTVSFAPGSNFTPGTDPLDGLRNAAFSVRGATRPAIITLRNVDNNAAFYDLIADGNSNSFYIQRPTFSGPPAFTISSSNNIGIGTAIPTVAASRSTLTVNGASGSDFYLHYNGSEVLSLQATTATIVGLNYPSSGTFNINRSGTNVANFDSGGNFAFNSGYGSVARAYACRAWVNVNGTTASPCTIRASGNVSSVTKSSTGRLIINFTNAMPDADYTASITSQNRDSNDDRNVAAFSERKGTQVTRSSSSFPLDTSSWLIGGYNGTAMDHDMINVSFFR